jgi:hypothetical protein
MKITSIEKPELGCSEIWAGLATHDGRCLRWFIELDGSRLDVWEEEVRCRHIDRDGHEQRCFVVGAEIPDGAKDAIEKAIRASMS